jgi:hypothetical protein
MASYADELVAVAGRLNIDPAWLANIIAIESRGGDPQAVNDISGATGLIQFMPCPICTAEDLGTTTSALYQMTGLQQMPYVERYFQMVMRRHGPVRSQEDVIAAVFYPAYIGQPDREMPYNVQRDNPGIRTLSDYTRILTSKSKLPVEGIAGGVFSGLGGGNKATQIAIYGSIAGLIILAAWRYQDDIRAFARGE